MNITRDAYDLTSAYAFITGRKTRRHKRRHRNPVKHSSGYDSHLRSEKWRLFRQEIISSRGKKCERCGVTGRIELHHKHYRTLGNEMPDDVMLLCVECHERYDKQRRGQRKKI